MKIFGSWLVLFMIHEFLARVLVVIPNYGISFGLVFERWWMVILGIFVVGWCWKKGYWLVAMGGGINLADRIRLGYVRDYWHLPLVGLYNNLADWMIFIGIILLGLSVWRHQK